MDKHNFDNIQPQMLNAIGEAVVATDLDGIIQYWNRAAEKFYQWQAKEVIGKNIIDVIPSITTKKQAKEIMQALSQGQSWAGEFEVQRKDGTRFLAYVSDSPIQNDQGELIGVIGISRDITERSLLERQLRDSEKHLSAVFNNTSDLQLFVRHEGNEKFRIIAANQSYINACNQYGLEIERNDLVGQTLTDLLMTILGLDENIKKYTLANYQKALNTGESVRYEESIMVSGALYHSEITLSPISTIGDAQQYVLYSSHDITAERDAIRSLQKSEEKFRNLYESSPFGIIICEILRDNRGKAIDFVHLEGNRAIAENTGFNLGDLIGKKASEVVDAIVQTDLTEQYEQVVRTRKTVNYVQYFDVYKKTLQVTAFPLDGDKFIINFIDITEKKEAESALVDNRNKLRAAIESMSDAVFISDIDGNFAEFNEAFATYHRFKNKDECFENLSQYPDILDVYLEDGSLAPLEMWAVSRALRGETVMDAEYVIHRKDIDKTWLGSYNFAPIRDNKGEIFGSVVVGRDITERKQAEQELNQQKDMFELVINSVPTRIFWKDLNSTYLGCNTAFAIAAGEKRPEDIIGKNDFDLIWSEEAEKYIADDRQIISSGMPKLGYEESYVTPDGKKIWWRTSKILLKDSTGKIFGILCTSEDITERKSADEKLKANEKRFRALFEQAGDYCMILDPNTADGVPIIVDANKAAYEQHGYTRDEYIGRPVADIDDEEGKKLVVERTKFIMTGKPFFVENTHVRKDGTTFSVSVHANRIDVDGYPPLIFTTEYDISERKEAERELENHRNHLEELVELRTKELNAEVKEHKLLFDLMLGREVRMAELKQAIVKLRKQLNDNGIEPAANDPMLNGL